VSRVIRRVEQGRLRGSVSEDGQVAAFKGIPYAAAPVGPLRWRPPQRPDDWNGVREATAFGPNAPQFSLVPSSLYAGGHERQSEDCLYLNVWTGPDQAEARPVLVWLHYGAFQFGGASLPLYDGENLARAGAVVVTLNYRLGRLGFLAHPELSAESAAGSSGNWGLLDQIAALEWVQRNIRQFGGDPGNVALVGLSAGSSSVSLVLLSPLADGLFQRAIAMSGSQLGPVGETGRLGDGLQDLEHAERSGVRVAEALGASSADDLRSASVEELMAVPPPDEPGPRWTVDAGMPIGRGVFDSAYPIVDGRVVPGDPYELYAAGRFQPVPLLTGSTADERSGVPYLTSLEAFLADAESDYRELEPDFLELFPARSDEEAVRSGSLANGDRIFVWQNWTLARLHAEAGRAPTFYYHTSRVPPLPEPHGLAEPQPGAFHSLEVPYLFRHLDVRPWPWEDHDRRLSEVISAYWLNFCRDGDPNGPGLPPWPAFDPAAPAVMHLGDEIGVGPVPRRAELDFWDRYFARERAAVAGAPA
jgi:para-nitrobenzyl esterase